MFTGEKTASYFCCICEHNPAEDEGAIAPICVVCRLAAVSTCLDEDISAEPGCSSVKWIPSSVN